MTIPSERQERGLQYIEADLAECRQAIGGHEPTPRMERLISQLAAERDRLLQSGGGEGCPHCGSPSRYHNAGCPAANPSTPAEPNPPGSGEPVAAFAETIWTNGLAEERDECDLSIDDIGESDPLWAMARACAALAAPLPSASEGAGKWKSVAIDLAEALAALRIMCRSEKPVKLEQALGWRENDELAKSLGDKALARFEALRTCATATGGGDNG